MQHAAYHPLLARTTNVKAKEINVQINRPQQVSRTRGPVARGRTGAGLGAQGNRPGNGDPWQPPPYRCTRDVKALLGTPHGAALKGRPSPKGTRAASREGSARSVDVIWIKS